MLYSLLLENLERNWCIQILMLQIVLFAVASLLLYISWQKIAKNQIEIQSYQETLQKREEQFRQQVETLVAQRSAELQAAENATRHTALLQSITIALAEALTLEQVANAIVTQVVPALGASAGLITLLSEYNYTLEVVKAVGYSPEALTAWSHFPATLSVPIADSVRTGKPIFLESKKVLFELYPHMSTPANQTNNEAIACIPLIVEGYPVGAMGLSFHEIRQFSQDDRAFMLALGQQCAQAMERAFLYEAEQNARNEAETANRMKDEFLAIVSHELRTPLNSILGWAQLLRTRKFDQATIDRAIETIERNARSQSQLIEDILDVSRMLRGKLQIQMHPVNLVSLIETAIESVRPAATAKAIQLTASLDPNVGLVSGDSHRLQQVMWNLLSNAIKFTNEGGQIQVRLSAIENLANSELAQNSLSAQIQIIDTGQGIDPKFLPNVFDRFCQADSGTTRLYGGLGLGLAIVRNLVDLHSGTVIAESLGEGLGSTFTVQLPLLEEKNLESTSSIPNSQSEIENSSTSLPLAGLQVLVVDDEPDAREFITAVLEEYGAKVTSTASAREALLMLEQLQPDILVSDIGMPVEDGYSLIRQVRLSEIERIKQIPALALTAYAKDEDSRQALSAGFQQHVAKPIETRLLVEMVATLANRIELGANS